MDHRSADDTHRGRLDESAVSRGLPALARGHEPTRRALLQRLGPSAPVRAADVGQLSVPRRLSGVLAPRTPPIHQRRLLRTPGLRLHARSGHPEQADGQLRRVWRRLRSTAPPPRAAPPAEMAMV
ncbi:hypothetical protein ACIF6L_13960 [Kitasatospora sp. NPDC086009]|uniref:hypothetical protein n=1 Tax=unclassified Kitasatospora TaxID=2633591 RepID=UPI0037C8472C